MSVGPGQPSARVEAAVPESISRSSIISSQLDRWVPVQGDYPFLSLLSLVLILVIHPHWKSSVNRRLRLPGQAAVRVSPHSSLKCSLPLPNLYSVPARAGSFQSLYGQIPSSVNTLSDPRSPWNQAVFFQAETVSAGCFSSLFHQPVLQCEELFIREVGLGPVMEVL